jgi:hypothetical protein
MSNTTLTADIIAKEAVMILDNLCVMGGLVYRGYEEDFSKKVNGYNAGDTITIRKPADYTVRDGAVMNVQDVVEGSTTFTVSKRKGVDFQFSSQDLTLKIDALSERAIKPAMVQLAHQVDADLMALYKDIPNWVGTPGQVLDSFADFAKAPARLDATLVPQDDRSGVLSSADYWGMLGNLTGLYMQSAASGAYREGDLGKIGGVSTVSTQMVPTHTVGADVTTVTFNQAITSATTTYASVKDSNQQTATIAGGDLNAGDVFTVTDVWDVHPVTKARLTHQKQFTVVSYSGNTLVFSPAMIWSGAFQNISTDDTDLNGATLTFQGTAATGYVQNMVFHKNAFGLVMVDLASPPGAVDVARRSYKGTRVRVIPVYDGINDVSRWRLDVLYGTKTIDPRLATRLSGT